MSAALPPKAHSTSSVQVHTTGLPGPAGAAVNEAVSLAATKASKRSKRSSMGDLGMVEGRVLATAIVKGSFVRSSSSLTTSSTGSGTE